jgi:hypothetical protein
VTKKPDPLAAGLDGLASSGTGGSGPRVLVLFGDRPEVLESIRRARRDRKLSYAAIAKFLTVNGEQHISAGAVQKWLDKEGIT